MKRTLAMILAIVMMLSLCACGGKTEEKAPESQAPASTAPEKAPEKAPESAAPVQGEYTMRIGIESAANEEDYEYMSMVMFAELVEKYSEGRIKTEIYPGSQLGSVLEMIEMQAMGNLEVTVTGFDTYTNFDPIFNLIVQPYMFNDMEHVKAFFETDNMAINALKAKAEEVCNAVIFGYSYRPMRTIGTKNTPIYGVADFKGLDARAPQVKAVTEFYSHLGAIPVSIPWGEVFTSLQNGTLSAADNAITTIVNGSTHELLGYLCETQHLMVSLINTMSADWFYALPTELQDAVMKAGDEATQWNWEHMLEGEERAWQIAEDAGVTCLRADDIDIASIREACKDLHKSYVERGDFTQEMFDCVVNLKY